MENAEIYKDAYDLLCGPLLGEGIHRRVFACRIDPKLVVKVELNHEWRYFSNVHEMTFWDDHEHRKAVSKWLAPCKYLSPDGRILLQHRVEPLTRSLLPDRLPAFLTDLKPENFGWLNGRVVCVDYVFTIPNPSLRLRKTDWKES